MSTIPSTSVLSLLAQGPDGVSTSARRPKAALPAERAFRDDSERARANQLDPERTKRGHGLVGESDRPPANVIRFPGGKASSHEQERLPPKQPPASFLTQVIGQEVQPEKLDAPASSRRHKEGIAAYEATLARTETITGPVYPIRKQI